MIDVNQYGLTVTLTLDRGPDMLVQVELTRNEASQLYRLLAPFCSEREEIPAAVPDD